VSHVTAITVNILAQLNEAIDIHEAISTVIITYKSEEKRREVLAGIGYNEEEQDAIIMDQNEIIKVGKT